MGFTVIFSAFAKALGQIGDPRFRRVMLLGALLALALLAGVYALFLALIDTFAPGSIDLPLVGPLGGIDTLLSIGSFLFMIALSVFLMVPAASAFSGLFLEDIVQAVEDRHYPDLPPVARLKLSDSLIDTANFLGLILAANLLCVVFYAFAGPALPLVFWGVNGFLLGREYFGLVATRRIGRAGAKALRAQHWGKIWLAGALMAAPLSVPLVNLVIPVLGVATFTHLFQALHSNARQEPRLSS